MAIDRRDASLLDFCPESIKRDPEIIALSHAVDPELQAVADAIVEAIILPRIASQPEWVINEMGRDHRLHRLGLWDLATLAGKKDLLSDIFKIRKKSGTPFALRRVFEALLQCTCEVVEWFTEAAPASTYRLILTTGIDGISFAQMILFRELRLRFARASASMAGFSLASNLVDGAAFLTTYGAVRFPIDQEATFTALLVGDGDGEPITPDPSMSELVNEVASVAPDSVVIVPGTPTLIHVEGTLPAATGGFVIREVGLTDASPFGLTAVGSHPPVYKPVTAGPGGLGDVPMKIRMTLEYFV